MTALFIRFGWFMLGAITGTWIMSDYQRASHISSTLNNIVDATQQFIVNIIASF